MDQNALLTRLSQTCGRYAAIPGDCIQGCVIAAVAGTARATRATCLVDASWPVSPPLSVASYARDTATTHARGRYHFYACWSRAIHRLVDMRWHQNWGCNLVDQCCHVVLAVDPRLDISHHNTNSAGTSPYGCKHACSQDAHAVRMVWYHELA